MEELNYPKTARIKKNKLVITEKLDGATLGIFKYNNELLIFQRTKSFFSYELDEIQTLYKGLYKWINKNEEELLNSLGEGQGFFGEWIGMGQIKYGDKLGDNKLFIFCTGQINEDKEILFLTYRHNEFDSYFNNDIPKFLSKVTIITETNNLDIDYKELFENYQKTKDYMVEGLVICWENNVRKYVVNKFRHGKLIKEQDD